MLRLSDPNEIRNPEGYLFTVAANLLKEMGSADRRTVSGLSAPALDAAQAAGEFPRIDTAVDAARRVDRLQVVLNLRRTARPRDLLVTEPVVSR